MLLPAVTVFCFLVLLFAGVWTIGSFLNHQQPYIAPYVINDIVLVAALITFALFLPVIIILQFGFFLMDRTPGIGNKIGKRMSTQSAYNLRSLMRYTMLPISMVVLTFMILFYASSEPLYLWLFIASFVPFAIFVGMQYGILDKKTEAAFHMRKFSQDVRIGVEQKGLLPNVLCFDEGLKTFSKILPEASHISHMGRCVRQVELVLFFGNEGDLYTLADHTLKIARSMETDYRESFGKEYSQLREFLEDFENGKKEFVELAEEVAFRIKAKKFSAEVLREVLVKTAPYLVAIAISILIWWWLGYSPEFPS